MDDPRTYNCTLCSTSFRRREHFERHLRTHSKTKDFRCDLCDKRFARRDTLQRHSTLHGEVPQKTQILPRAPRACLHCVKSKQRCSGSYPCDRCSRKGWSCQFGRGSVKASPQEQVLPNTEGTESFACELPLNAIQPDPESLNGFTGWPCADPLPSQTRQPSPFTETAWDPLLFWPLDDAFGNPDMDSPYASGFYPPSVVGPEHLSMSLDSPNNQQHSNCSDAQTNYISEEDSDILIAEDYGHTPKPSISTYERICAHYAQVRSEDPLPSLYSLDVLHVCTQLYFEHFHQGFPILHQATFEARSSSWLLYIAVAAIGSQYSRLSNRTRIFADLVKAMRLSLLRKLSFASSLQNNLELAQATLLFNFALLFSGTRENLMHLQYQRNVLVTMCRPLLIPSILYSKSSMSNANAPAADWNQWIVTESWKRLVYFTWLNECFQVVLFDLPTLIAVNDLHLSMPRNDELWQCASARDWGMVMQRDSSESFSVPSLLRVEALDSNCIRSLSEPALWIMVLAVYISERHSTQQQAYPYPSIYSSPAESVDPDSHEPDVDQILKNIQQASTLHNQKSPLLPIVTKFSLVLRLLRFIPYRHLYVSSGWMAQQQELDASAQHIARLLHSQPQQARQTLIHAAHLFRIIRSQRQFDPFDSFLLLMAVLYIWNYDRFVVSAKTQATSTSGAGAETIIRIDQDMSKDIQEKWIAGTLKKHQQLHISGVGVLNGNDSVPRILRESIKILGHENAWSSQAGAIRRALRQIVFGGVPSFPAEGEGEGEGGDE